MVSLGMESKLYNLRVAPNELSVGVGYKHFHFNVIFLANVSFFVGGISALPTNISRIFVFTFAF